MASVRLSQVQKAKQSLVKRLVAEPGFVGAGVSTGVSGEFVIIVLVEESTSPVLAKVPKEWQGIPVRTEVGGTPRKF